MRRRPWKPRASSSRRRPHRAQERARARSRPSRRRGARAPPSAPRSPSRWELEPGWTGPGAPGEAGPVLTETPPEPVSSGWWTPGRVIVTILVVGMVSMWAYVLFLAFGPGRQDPVDRLRDP